MRRVVGIGLTTLVVFVTLLGARSVSTDRETGTLLVVAAAGLLLRLPERVPLFAALVTLLGSAVGLLLGNDDLAQHLGELSFYGLAIGCLWAVWGFILDTRDVVLPLHAAAAKMTVGMQAAWGRRDALASPAGVGALTSPWRSAVVRRGDAAVGIVGGALLVVWLLSSTISAHGFASLTGDRASLENTGPTDYSPRVIATAQALSCATGSTPEYYEIIRQHRPDILAYYVKQPWRPNLTCRQVYDDWLQSGVDFPATTAQVYVTSEGWLAPTPTPHSSISAGSARQADLVDTDRYVGGEVL